MTWPWKSSGDFQLMTDGKRVFYAKERHGYTISGVAHLVLNRMHVAKKKETL
jgi:hypothetical protein